MPKIKVIPMLKKLQPWAKENNVPLDIRRWESIVRCYSLYTKTVK